MTSGVKSGSPPKPGRAPRSPPASVFQPLGPPWRPKTLTFHAPTSPPSHQAPLRIPAPAPGALFSALRLPRASTERAASARRSAAPRLLLTRTLIPCG